MEPRARIGPNIYTCWRGPPPIQLLGYEHREDAVGGGGPGKCQHTHSFHRDTQGGWNHGQGSETILTHVCLAPPLIKSLGYEHREDALGVG